jgi:hypothetical protein
MRLRHSAFHCLVLTCLGCLGFAKNKSAGWVSALNLGSDVPRMSFGLTAALQSGCRRGLELCHLYRSTVDRRRLFRSQRRDLVAPIEGQDRFARSRKSRSDGPTCGLCAETLQTHFTVCFLLPSVVDRVRDALHLPKSWLSGSQDCM